MWSFLLTIIEVDTSLMRCPGDIESTAESEK